MEWSNQACIGYVVLAAQRIGLSIEQTQGLIDAMRYEHDETSVEEAEDVFYESDY